MKQITTTILILLSFASFGQTPSPTATGIKVFGIAGSISQGDSIISFGKNAANDSTILVLKDGRRFAAKDSSGGSTLTDTALIRTIASDTAQSLRGLIAGKQNTLVSGSNIKTVNGNSILGSGDIVISSGSGGISKLGTSDSTLIKINDSTYKANTTVLKTNWQARQDSLALMAATVSKNDTTLVLNKSINTKGLIIGNSTVATYDCGTEIGKFLFTTIDSAYNNSYKNQAVPGDSIAGQLTKFLADTNKVFYDWVIIEIGLNDLNPAIPASVSLLKYQSLVDSIRSRGKKGVKVITSSMTPCKLRLYDVYGGVNGPLSYQKWIDMNYAIMGGGVNKIINVDYRVNEHISVLSDEYDNLNVLYDCGDHIHENNAARNIIASTWRKALNELGFLRNQQPKVISVANKSKIETGISPTGGASYPTMATFYAIQGQSSSSSYPIGAFNIGASSSDVSASLQVSALYSAPALQIPVNLIVSTNKDIINSNSYQLYIQQSTTSSRIITARAANSSLSATPIQIAAGNTNTNLNLSTNGMVYVNGTTAAHSTLQINGSFAATYTSTNSSITLSAVHNSVAITATGQTITLPTAVGIQGRVYTIKLTAAGTGTVATISSQTIDGATTYSLSAQYKYVTIQSDNANWNIIGNN